MTTIELFQLISIILAFVLGIVGIFLNYTQIKQTNKANRADFIYRILDKLRCNEKITNAMRLIEYNEKWYNNEFHNSLELEASIDSLFSQLDYICYLYKNKQIKKNEFNIFEYEIKRVCANKQSREYLWNLYHWYNGQTSFNNLISYLFTMFTDSQIKEFKSSKNSSYIKILNF